jgi:hypothetical protein
MLLLLPRALAYESEPQSVDLADEVQLFTNYTYSTGVLPEGSPLGVQFSIEVDGGASVSMEGQADLSWPDALTLLYTGTPGSGIFLLDEALEGVTEVVVDLSDLGLDYSGTFEVDRRSLAMDATGFFDPFVLDGATTDRVELTDTTDAVQLISYSYEIFAGVSLDFDATMTPVVTAGFEGVYFSANDALIQAENTASAVASEQVASYDVPTLFRGAWDATLSLVFTPTISVTASVFGTYEIASFDIPVDILVDAFEDDFPVVDLAFPLPLMVADDADRDFGEVELGDDASIEFPITNEGELGLYGTAVITGSADFSVFPETFNANGGTTDGLVVTFLPTAEGAQEATLLLSSNDPTVPELAIGLIGNGAQGSDDGGYAEEEKVGGAASSCGCHAATGAPLLAGLVGALALVRRRRA